MDRVGQGTEDVILLQTLNELTLKLVGDGIAAVLVNADRQSVPDFRGAVAAHHVPEGFTVLGGRCRAHISLAAGLGISVHGSGGGSGELGVHLHLILQTGDLVTECLDVRGHLVVLLDSGSLYETVGVAVLFQKSLGLLPQGIALVAKFDDLTHDLFPP